MQPARLRNRRKSSGRWSTKPIQPWIPQKKQLMTCKKCSALRRRGKDFWLPCLRIRNWRMICAPWSVIFARTVFFFIETARQRLKRARASRRNRPVLKAEADNDTVAHGQSAARAVHHILRGGRRAYFVGFNWRFVAGPRAGR